ncbi:hypothetical protein V8B55DRAFT_1511900 [Mucor lusitanicus]
MLIKLLWPPMCLCTALVRVETMFLILAVLPCILLWSIIPNLHIKAAIHPIKVVVGFRGLIVNILKDLTVVIQAVCILAALAMAMVAIHTAIPTMVTLTMVMEEEEEVKRDTRDRKAVIER